MKKLLLSFLLITTLGFSYNSNNSKPTSSFINEVIVYINGAQITRTAKISLPVGTTQFTFNKLSPNIQESSIQISGLKSASILSINYGINFLTKQNKSNQIITLQDQIKVLNEAIELEDNLILGYKEELSVIQTNRQLGNENQVVNLVKLQEFATYYRKRITEVNNLINKSLKKKRSYNKQITEIQQQLTEFNVDDKEQTGDITVKLNTSVPHQLELVIKYNVTEAGWFPVYNLKANSINTPIELGYKAHVYQKTGIDWNNIKLTLSTSDPNTNNIKPDVNPKYLNFINRYSNYNSTNATKNYNYKYNPFIKTVSGIVTDETGLPLPGVNVIVKGTTNGVATGFDGKYSINTNGGKELVLSYIGYITETLPIHSSIMNVAMEADVCSLDEVVVIGYVSNSTSNTRSSTYKKKEKKHTSNGDIIEDGITTRRFEIKKEHSMPSDGEITVIEIDNYSIPAKYSYYAAPLVNENVFLTAKIGDWEQFNLLPGEANIYFEGSYSGKTNINPQATTDSLTVSLGVDPNVVIKRNTVNNFKKTTFIGNNKIVNKAFEIELKNNKRSPVDLVLIDRIPISQNKEIKVDDIVYGTANYDSKKGLLEWKVDLASDQSVSYKFSYSLKYPKYKKINL
ncbi:mucoidy inhibitor MuiA family protein [Flavivirga jejuensis]|uniref:Mucoidy inhibitor MuiA family protein n=1 Tax=Flavivirga jejuensis TaxID=870487 RepID=A0ABT8WRX1_9FLAO|nr:mucoidy inhibitor MuiA family protein [Flavivirga jejuensis]MDO5975943.1 mucoidy inhibitor MuiA family protein [Flavivirga jejuensis]